MIKNKNWLYIPIETKVRELYGKVLMASLAAINGFDVIIGSKRDINLGISFFPKGIIFNFGLADNFSKNSRRYKELGHNVAVIDEEGLVTLNDELYLKYRVSREANNVTDVIFCWGEKQASLLRNKIDNKKCIFVTGNPRFDMLRPEFRYLFSGDVEKIKHRYGKIILINTNFGYANYFSGEEAAMQSLKSKGWMDNSENKKYFLRRMEWQKTIYEKFLELIPKLSEKFKDYNIIIRPHPSENHNNWKKIEKNFSNVFVVHQGNVIPWILAADVLIHNGCTTAIEARLLGIAALAYRPLIVKDVESELPNKISLECYDENGLVNSLERLLLAREETELNFCNLSFNLSGFDGKTASEQIIHTLKNFSIEIKDRKVNNLKMHLLFALHNAIISTLNKINISNSAKYLLHKTPNITDSDISEIIMELSKINNDFNKIKIRRIGGTCYHIFRENNL